MQSESWRRRLTMNLNWLIWDDKAFYMQVLLSQNAQQIRCYILDKWKYYEHLDSTVTVNFIGRLTNLNSNKQIACHWFDTYVRRHHSWFGSQPVARNLSILEMKTNKIGDTLFSMLLPAALSYLTRDASQSSLSVSDDVTHATWLVVKSARPTSAAILNTTSSIKGIMIVEHILLFARLWSLLRVRFQAYVLPIVSSGRLFKYHWWVYRVNIDRVIISSIGSFYITIIAEHRDSLAQRLQY